MAPPDDNFLIKNSPHILNLSYPDPCHRGEPASPIEDKILSKDNQDNKKQASSCNSRIFSNNIPWNTPSITFRRNARGSSRKRLSNSKRKKLTRSLPPIGTPSSVETDILPGNNDKKASISRWSTTRLTHEWLGHSKKAQLAKFDSEADNKLREVIIKTNAFYKDILFNQIHEDQFENQFSQDNDALNPDKNIINSIFNVQGVWRNFLIEAWKEDRPGNRNLLSISHATRTQIFDLKTEIHQSKNLENATIHLNQICKGFEDKISLLQQNFEKQLRERAEDFMNSLLEKTNKSESSYEKIKAVNSKNQINLNAIRKKILGNCESTVPLTKIQADIIGEFNNLLEDNQARKYHLYVYQQEYLNEFCDFEASYKNKQNFIVIVMGLEKKFNCFKDHLIALQKQAFADEEQIEQLETKISQLFPAIRRSSLSKSLSKCVDEEKIEPLETNSPQLFPAIRRSSLSKIRCIKFFRRHSDIPKSNSFRPPCASANPKHPNFLKRFFRRFMEKLAMRKI